MLGQRIVLLLSAYLSAPWLYAQAAKPSPQTPVSAEVNKALPTWLRFSGEERTRMENLNGVAFKDAGDLYVLNRLRLDMEVRPVSWLRLQFEAEAARVFGQNTLPAPASQKDAMDLRVGYLQVGTEEGPVMFRGGRLPLAFGEGRVLADPAWSNVGRTFDGGRVSVHGGPVRVDLFSGDVVKVDPMGFDEPTPGSHFHGIYGTVGQIVPNATIEPYLLWRLDSGYKSEAGVKGTLDEKTLGLRFAGKLRAFDWGVEMADQIGASAGDRLHSWAGHWAGGYTLPNKRYRPRVFSEFNRASGDANAHDGIRGGFDPLFPSTHDKLGLTDVFTWTNLAHWRTGLGWTLMPRVTMAVAYSSFWLADAHDAVYCGGKAIARSADGSAGTHIGQQADLQAAWTPARSTQIQVGYGRLFPGEFLQKTTAHVPFSIVFLNVAQRF